jgi:formate dehydrogenase maturation protein FdhE
LVTRETTAKILGVLQKQEKEEGKLPLLLEFYRALLQTQDRVRASMGTLEPTISANAIQSRLSHGQPLVKFDELALDRPSLRKVFVEVAAVFGQYPRLFGEMPPWLTNQNTGKPLTKKAVRAWYDGKALPSALLEGINENLIKTIILSTLHPFLAAHAEALADAIEPDSWHMNFCPVCGGMPDIAYMEKTVGARRLVCSRCDAEWQFHRIECPYCRTQEQTSLSFLADEENFYRLYLCENCKCYLKVIDLRKTEAEVFVPLERLYTLDLDRQAHERGYHSCPG